MKTKPEHSPEINADKLTDQLRETFKLVNEWLRFAEAKNAAIFGANAGLAFGVAKALFDSPPPAEIWMKVGLCGALLCSVCACLVALSSFLPQLRFQKSSAIALHPHHSLLYFGALQSFKADALVNSTLLALRQDADGISEIDRHYADQIVTNSGITTKKYKLFARAGWLTFAAILFPVFAFAAEKFRELF